MAVDFPSERWFWFAPPFKNSGQSALLHKQPDNIWRIDFQLGWDIDRTLELREDRIRARVDAMLSSQTGRVPDYELVWTSIYRFHCRRIEAFRHGPLFFAGDSAHQLSPFGARGANSGVQDAENLAWKLDLVLRGKADASLLDSYHDERAYAADENILNSSRATDFMTPKSEISTCFRDAVLALAGKAAFARPLVNSGRLSVPCVYDGFPLFGEDALQGPAITRPGAACSDAPLAEGFLLDRLSGAFTLLTLGGVSAAPLVCEGIPLVQLHIAKPSAALRARYLGEAASAAYLIRPDQHIVARWTGVEPDRVARAMRQALGRNQNQA